MTRDQALKQARKRWGKQAYLRAYDVISSPERREAARQKYQAAKDQIAAIDAEIAERLKQLDWYQELQAKRLAARKERDANDSGRYYQRFYVGKNVGWANEVKGQGDTWEEAFAQADSKAAKSA